MVSGSSAVSDSLQEAFRALLSSLRPFRGVFLQDTLSFPKMATTPDQLVAPVQPDRADLGEDYGLRGGSVGSAKKGG